MSTGYLLLETGDIFAGQLIGQEQQEVVGEVVFNTSMTGYEEIMTNPSCAGQIVTFCYPLIGNCGLNMTDHKNGKPHLAGMVVGEWCEYPSHYSGSVGDWGQQLREAGVTCLSGVDTRALVKLIRRHGTVRGTIMSAALLRDPAQASQAPFWEERKSPVADTLQWVDRVSTKTIQTYTGHGLSVGDPLAEEFAADHSQPIDRTHGSRVVLMDYGCQPSLIDLFLKSSCQVIVVPYTTTYEQLTNLHPDGVVFSNGPGDPLALRPYFAEIRKISESFPTLGIGLGHQLLALVHGAQTEKLKYGHRGANHPVKEVHSGKVLMTSQSHGYAVVSGSIDANTFHVTHHNVNDGSVEGLQHVHLPLQTIQFQLEEHSVSAETAHIFQQFMEKMHTGDMPYAIT